MPTGYQIINLGFSFCESLIIQRETSNGELADGSLTKFGFKIIAIASTNRKG
jgi:hypothetical protein